MSTIYIRKTIQYIIFTTLAVVLLWYSLQKISLEEFIVHLQATNYYLVGLSLLAALLGYVSRAARWKILIESMGYKPGLLNCYNSMMLGYLANFIFPRIGEITRCGMLGKRKKIPIDRLIGTVILERAFDLVMLILLVIILIIGKYSAFGPFIGQSAKVFMAKIWHLATQNWWVLLLLICLVIGSFIYSRKYKRRILRFQLVRKILRGIRGIKIGIKTILRLQQRMKFIFHTLLIWIMYWTMTYLVVLALPVTSGLSPLDGLFILVLAGIGMSMPVQGGIGAFHTIMMLGLGLYGISENDGVSFAVLMHESQSVLAILLGLFSVFLLYLSGEKKIILKPEKDEIP